MPVTRRSPTALVLLLLVAVASPAAAGRTTVDYGSPQLGQIVPTCFYACFGTSCSAAGTIDSVQVSSPFHVRGVRLARTNAGDPCSPSNRLSELNLSLPRTVGSNQALVFDVDILPTTAGSVSRNLSINGVAHFELEANVQPVTFCSPGSTSHCLNNDRFKVRDFWRSFDGARGHGGALSIGADDSGLFYFFNSDNVESILKVLDGCGLNDRYWVFAASTTNVEYTITVVDTDTQVVKSYFNPLGTAAPAITDTSAFATCP